MLRLNKSCDQCRRRKVRCIVPQIPSAPWGPPACIRCINRSESCQFSPIKRNLRARSQKVVTPGEPSPEREEEFLIDRLLRDGPQQNQQVPLSDETAIIKASNNRVSSSAISFFSSQRIEVLTKRLEADGLKHLVDGLESLITKHICGKRNSNFAVINLDKLPGTVEVTAAEAEAYIEAYFENLHPLYPFLDRQEFASHVLELRTKDTENTNKALSALYHSVLALGSQYHNGGSFVPGSGKSWALFQICLGHVPDLIVPAHSLVKLQALTAMSIFAMNSCCLQLDQTLIYEAARVAQYLRYHKSCNAQESHLRLFWTIYYIEKMTAFYESNSSMIADEDIGCAVPAVPESTIGGYDWFLSATRLARLSSMTYTSLFSTQATQKTGPSFLASIKRIKDGLEQWRLSVPMAYRPREGMQLSQFDRPSTRWLIIQTQYLYYNLVIAVERLSLHADSEDDANTRESQRNLMDAAQGVIERVPFIDVAPHMPIFMAGVMPMSAVFVLFDLVVRYPRHSETNKNLAALDQAAEYFTRFENASNGFVPGKNMAEFATIARHYVRKVQFDSAGPGARARQRDLSMPNFVQGPEQLGQWNSDIELETLCASSADDMGGVGGNHLPAVANSVTPLVDPPSSLDPAIPLENSGEPDYPIGPHPMFGFVFPDWTLDDTTIAEWRDSAAPSEYAYSLGG